MQITTDTPNPTHRPKTARPKDVEVSWDVMVELAKIVHSHFCEECDDEPVDDMCDLDDDLQVVQKVLTLLGERGYVVYRPEQKARKKSHGK